MSKTKNVSTEMQVEPPTENRRYWPRPEEDRHILGEIRCIMVGETQVKALMLYETSHGRGGEPPVLTQLRGKVVGSMDAIRCTICGKVHDWIIGQDALDELLSKVKGA